MTIATKVKARWTFPVNFRQEDHDILDALIEFAKEEQTNLTTIIRGALKEYALAKTKKVGTVKMDRFLGDTDQSILPPVFHEMLTPDRLRGWSDGELISFAKAIRGRKQEISEELKKRGYHFVW